MFLFSSQKKPDPVEQAKSWKRQLQQEGRRLDREIGKLRTEEKKAMAEMKKLAKDKRIEATKILARQVVNVRRAVESMMTAQAQMNSIGMQLQSQVAIIKVQGAMSKSTEIMKLVGNLIKLPEIQESMLEMSREMIRSGMIEDSVNEALDSLNGDEVEAQAQVEMEKILAELSIEVTGRASAVPTSVFTKVGGTAVAEAPAEVEEEEEDAEVKAMQERLQKL